MKESAEGESSKFVPKFEESSFNPSGLINALYFHTLICMYMYVYIYGIYMYLNIY
jgi:hypothetical protein